MDINPYNWRLNVNKTCLFNIENGTMIFKQQDYFKIEVHGSSNKLFYLLKDNSVSTFWYNPENKRNTEFIDEVLYSKLERIFNEGFNINDYNAV